MILKPKKKIKYSETGLNSISTEPIIKINLCTKMFLNSKKIKKKFLPQIEINSENKIVYKLHRSVVLPYGIKTV